VGGGAKSSLMFVKFGKDYLTGWQKKGMDVFKWQLGVLKYVEMDWAAGVFFTDPRSVAWVYNVTAK